MCFKICAAIFMLFLLNTGSAGTEKVKVEFSNLAKVLPWSKAAGSASKGGVILCSDRESVAAGERWFDVVVHLDGETAALEGTMLRVEVADIGSDNLLEEVKQAVASDRALVRVDMRQPGRQHLQIKAEWLSPRGAVLGVGKMIALANGIKPLAPGTRIPIHIDLPEGATSLDNYPVRFGLPLPEGAVWEADGLKVVDASGKELPSQLEIAGRWAQDGAVKWMWVDALVSGGAQDIYVIAGERTAAGNPFSPLKVEKQGDGFIIDTGAARYVVGADGALIKEARINNRVVAKEGNLRGLYLIDQKGQLAKVSAQDADVKLESAGPVSAVVRIEGFYRTAQGEALAGHITRLKFDAGRPEAQATHTLIIARDTNEVWFRDIGWEFEVTPGASAKALFNISKEIPQEIKTLPVSGNTAISMLQREGINLGLKPSGFAMQTLKAAWTRTPPVTAWTSYFYGKYLSVIKEGGKTIYEGAEMGDWAALSGTGGGLMLSCRDAAVQHPKEFEVAAGRVNLKLFSSASGKELDFKMKTLMKNWGMLPMEKIQLDDEVPQETLENYLDFIKGHPINAIGWSKTHEILLAPFVQASGLGEASLLHSGQVFAHVDPRWIRETEAMDPVAPKDEKGFPEAETIIGAFFWRWSERGGARGGFIDYHAGPLETSHGYGWRNGSYELRLLSWYVYVRSSERDKREMTQGTNRAFADNSMCHWDGPEKIKGLIISNTHKRGNPNQRNQTRHLPLYWEDVASGINGYNIATSFNLNQILYDYYITGYRRAGDIGRNYAQAAKENLTAEQGHGRPIQAVRQIAHAYALTWEPRLRELIYEINERQLYDPEGAVLLTKTRGYGTTYKTQTDSEVFIDLWKLLRDPLFYRMAETTNRFHWENVMLLNPSYGGNRCTGVGGHFLWKNTQDKRIPGMFDYSRRNLVSQNLNVSLPAYYKTFKYGEDTVWVTGGSASPKYMKGLMLAIDVLSRTGAHEKPVASWLAFNTETAPASVFFNKPADGEVKLIVRREPRSREQLGDTSSPSHFQVGSSVSLKSHAKRAPYAWIGQDLNSIRETRREYAIVVAEVTAAKDGPGGTYELILNEPGNYSIFADSAVPLAFYAPAGFVAERMNPPVKTYFKVLEGAQGARISFQNPTSVFTPDGKDFGEGEKFSGWVSLPQDKPGIWSFESIDAGKVQTENLSGFFAMGSPDFYMEK